MRWSDSNFFTVFLWRRGHTSRYSFDPGGMLCRGSVFCSRVIYSEYVLITIHTLIYTFLLTPPPYANRHKFPCHIRPQREPFECGKVVNSAHGWQHLHKLCGKCVNRHQDNLWTHRRVAMKKTRHSEHEGDSPVPWNCFLMVCLHLIEHMWSKWYMFKSRVQIQY